ncbi:MAG: DegT/DnrJ/EryC1/StrS family aminotransferase [Ignavibacteriaceae bacterium]|nr:DegT/DnrJ/EryC1/StrS family aminotransferase [Ignavibacteriaceae bacterium]
MAVINEFDLKSPVDSIRAIKRFESHLARFHNVRYAFATNSATSGLYLSGLSLGLKRGDRIITSPISWPQTYLPFAYLGCDFIIVDYMKEYPVVNPSEVEVLLKKEPQAKAVLVPILFGLAEGVKEISIICRKHRVVFIVDASQAFFSLIDDKPISFYADMLIVSFSNFKDYGYGEGGAILTNSISIIDKLHLLTSHPIRIHSDVSDLAVMVANLEGFNFNFRMHPATAIHLDNLIKSKKIVVQNSISKKIPGVLEPPKGIKKCANKEYLLLDLNSAAEQIAKYDSSELIRLVYPTLFDLYAKYNGKVFYWLDNTFTISSANDIKFAFYWKENLALIHKAVA